MYSLNIVKYATMSYPEGAMDQDFVKAPEQTIEDESKLLPADRLHLQRLRQWYTFLVTKIVEGTVSQPEAVDQLVYNHRSLEKAADTDGLTGLLNYQGFGTVLDRELPLLRRLKLDGALLVIDVDYLKRFNDSLGHPAGDQLLKSVATAMQQQTREADPKGRLGGDEFAAFLIGADVAQAQEVAKRIVEASLGEAQRLFSGYRWNRGRVVSIGISPVDEMDNSTSLRERADLALYEAKTNPVGIVTHVENIRGR